VEYEKWIERERRFRSALLISSPEIREKGYCRICQNCNEICLCHETRCPNCGSKHIVQQIVPDLRKQLMSGRRINCKKRYEKILHHS